MKISDKNKSAAILRTLTSDRILFLDSKTKAEAFEQLIKSLSETNEVTDCKELQKGILYRESLMSTGIGLEIGVPHVRLPSVKNIVMSVGVCLNPLCDYESLDNKPVRVIFMIAAGKNQHTEYIRLLASISSKLKHSAIKEKLLELKTPEEIYELLTCNEII